ncbi:MAG: hypothetical protein U1G05_01730 [Kiritimatiellia bacterium]
MAAQVAASNRVENCVIAHGGRHYFSSIGLWPRLRQHVGAQPHLRPVLQRLLGRLGVGLRGQRGEAQRIADNRQHIGHGLLCDMGGIYTLGRSEGTLSPATSSRTSTVTSTGDGALHRRGQHGHPVREQPGRRHQSTGGFHQHYGRENIVRNNLLANARRWQLQASRAEDHLSFTFENNLVPLAGRATC